MPPKTSHTLRLGKTELEWLSRHGKGLGRQLREDLALLRVLMRLDADTPVGMAIDVASEVISE